MTSKQQTLQQERAAHAWANIEQVDQKDASFKKDYGSLIRGLAALVKSDGLGQTLAFLKAKAGGDTSKREHLAYSHLQGWLMNQLGAKGDLLLFLLSTDSSTYRRATTEALAYLQWLKRFSEAQGWKSEED